MIFWDTSAFARCFLTEEAGHDHAANLLIADPRHAGSVLLFPETASAFLRRTRPGDPLRQETLREIRRVLSAFLIVDFDMALSASSVDLVISRGLRGADAVHLASALQLSKRAGRRGFFFATSDAEQAVAARRSGLRVLSPGAK